jgi:hypothetical protein
VGDIKGILPMKLTERQGQNNTPQIKTANVRRQNETNPVRIPSFGGPASFANRRFLP